MKAITYEKFGAAADVLKLADIDLPAPGPGEVTVELSRSGVNPSDTKARAGTRPGVTEPPFPVIIPHSDGAGVITAIGEGVEPGRKGQRVWVWNGQWRRAFGTAAQSITLPAEQAVALPEGIGPDTGASLGIPGLTACHAVFGGGEVKDKTLLIQGGSGSVGHLAVQLAHWGGARVIATASAANLARCEAAGADAALDHSAPDLAAQILEANDGDPIERIVEVEFGRNLATDAEVIAENGTIAAYGSQLEMAPTLNFGPLLFKAVTIDVLLIYLLPKQARDLAIARLHSALTQGALDCPVAETFPLARTAEAHEAVERGAREGAILVDTSG
ncbi:NADPH:quinone reductase [Sulfitobacter sp. D35]|uniref:NADPH:quinone reductase n=1 Tax=Sulfitobacter sp. D35 TaxID=3083252 RepID=UPI00296E686C|nr:NADPH:quinone reductase [Sulfitobacter sp. D35]MDW4499755.1 NADPH:quinone reductase [Sulfitobacter sp. D35]